MATRLVRPYERVNSRDSDSGYWEHRDRAARPAARGRPPRAATGTAFLHCPRHLSTPGVRTRPGTGIIGTVVDSAATAHSDSGITDPPQPAKRKQAVMRTPGSAIIAIFLLLVGMTPAAWTLPGMLVLYVIPAALLYVVLRLRTTVTPDAVHVRRLFTQHRLPWGELRGLLVNNRGTVSAVTTDGTNVKLPSVRGKHLPVMSLISDGRLPDPTGLTAEDATSHSAEQDQDHDAAGRGQHQS